MRKNIIKFILTILVGLLVVLLFYKAFVTTIPQLWQVLRHGNEADIEAFLTENGDFTGVMYLALLQFIQVSSIVIPSAPIRIAGGLVYGAWKGFVACHLSYVAANVLIFYIVRHFKASIASISPRAKGQQEKVAKMLDRGDPFIAVILACMIPAVPNGIIPYASANTKLTGKSFAIAVYLGSILSTFIMCAIGRRLLSGDYLLSIVLFVLNLLVIYVLYRNEKRLSRLVSRIRKGANEK